MRTSALNFCLAPLLFSSRSSLLASRFFLFRILIYFSLPHRSSWNQKKENPEEHRSFFSSSQETKTNLMENSYFIYFFKFKAQCLSIFQSVCLSDCLSPLPGTVCEHRVVETIGLSPRAPPPYSDHLSGLYCNTVKRRVCLVERERPPSPKPVINNEQNKHNKKKKDTNKDNRLKTKKKSCPVSRISVFLKIKSYPPALFWQASFLNKH